MQSLLAPLKKGLAIVFSGPAGTGKTTLEQMLLQEFPGVVKSISFTTRKPRLGEVDGVHYIFITREVFEEKIAQGEFLEHVLLYGDYYGTSRNWIAEKQAEQKHVLLVIDTQGARQLMGKFPALFIFVRPPSVEVLRERLINRKSNSARSIEERLAWATKELEAAVHYDYVFENRDLNSAYQIFRSILIAETHHRRD